MKIAAIIPALNEEKTISTVVNSVKEFGYHPVVVSDGSTDSTILKAQQSGAYVIKHKISLGYDQSIKTGVNFVLKKNFDFLLIFDADNEINIDCLEIFKKKIVSKKYSLIIGARNSKPRISEVIFGYYTKIRYNVPDILSGIKAYSIELCRKNKEIFEKNTYNTGLAINALKNKEKFCIVPIKINFLRAQSRIGRKFSINLKIFQIMFLEITQDLKSLLKKAICK